METNGSGDDIREFDVYEFQHTLSGRKANSSVLCMQTKVAGAQVQLLYSNVAIANLTESDVTDAHVLSKQAGWSFVNATGDD